MASPTTPRPRCGDSLEGRCCVLRKRGRMIGDVEDASPYHRCGGIEDNSRREWYYRMSWKEWRRCRRTPPAAPPPCFQLWTNLLALYLLALSSCSGSAPNEIQTGVLKPEQPQFGESISNVTVAAGRDASLSCVVDNLGDFRVGWLKVDTQTILSLQKRVVTHNTRVSVTHDEHRTWNLHIKQVKESDRGCYMCQINTPIMKNKVGCIEVHVSPNIIDEMTSSDTTINEGDIVNLSCVAEGYPKPVVKWKREDGREIIVKTSSRDPSKRLDSVQGGNLTLEGVTRKQMGAYLCIASNKVPPSVSKRIILNVNFSPVVKVDNQLIGSPLATNVEIMCHVEAFPKAVNYWERDNGEMLLNGTKYQLEESVDEYRVTLKLVIKSFTRLDAGQYKCISTNSLGKADTNIRLYVIEVNTPRATTEHLYYPTTQVSPLDLIRRNGGQLRSQEAGSDGSSVAYDHDFENKEENRQRQRQRLHPEDTLGGAGGGFLGNQFPSGEGEGGNASSAHRNVKSPVVTTMILSCWWIILYRVLARHNAWVLL